MAHGTYIVHYDASIIVALTQHYLVLIVPDISGRIAYYSVLRHAQEKAVKI